MEKTPSILLVDDEPDFLDNLSLTLQMAGYQTVTARDGVEALAILQTRPVDLIVSDISMPHLDGYKLHEQVRKDSRWATIPFLFLTGCSFLSAAEISYGKTLGVDEYFTKPIRAEELLLAVWSTLEPAQCVPTEDVAATFA